VRGPRRWFMTLLRLFPARFRERHGDDMSETFERAYEESRAAGRRHLVAFLARTTLDLGSSGLRERVAARRRRRQRLGCAAGGALVSWLDVKLGVRMLRKHPGLTLVSTLALAVGIPVGLAPSHFVDGLLAPLPVPEGDRIRALRLWSPKRGRAETTTSLDFEAWRPALSSFEGLGAYRETQYNLDVEEGRSVRGAAVTASTFDLLRVPPLIGRTIQQGDMSPGGEAVAVVGYDLWQALYGGDPALVGRSIRLATVPHTVVGVMPKGFLFPEHQSIWTPLRMTAADAQGAGTPVSIFGRLETGVTEASAQVEFGLVAQRSVRPGRDPGLKPQVVAHGYALLPGLAGGLRATPEFLAFQSLALMVLLVACANVGMLVFARTANRGSELAVRTVLGASRARIVAQVFTECLVLAVLASGLGMALMAFGLNIALRLIPARLSAALPYWIDWSIGGRTALGALGLAAVSAVGAGVVPALRFTGASVQRTIQRARARRTGSRFGGLSGALIVADVAVAVTAVGFAATAYDLVRSASSAPATAGIPADEYLAARLSFPSTGADGPDGDGAAARMAATQQELVRLLRAEPGVRTVAVADALPRMEHRSRLVEAEGVDPPGDRPGVSVRTARVDIGFFQSLEQPILAGRGFDAGDLEGDRSAVIVNTTFVERVLGGGSALGRRIRFVTWGGGEAGPWKEVVGVVGHLGMRMISAQNDQGVYEPFAPGELPSVRLGIRVGEDPSSFAPHLRALAHEVDPEAIVSVTGPLDEVYEGDWYILLASSLGAGLLVGVLLALAASGIYAIMSFAVTQRAQEIGVRAALGASRSDLVRTVAKRAIRQLGAGVLLGTPLSILFFSSGEGSLYTAAMSTLLVGAGVMMLVGLAACTGPTLRALRVDPSRALSDTS